jgi:enoyl-CoA hydratase
MLDAARAPAQGSDTQACTVPDALSTLTYEVTVRIARITLNRPERGNGSTLDTPRELDDCLERANLDPAAQAITLAGAGKAFCGG